VGVRHALFPRSLTFGAQLHPSSVVGCQFPDAALVCMDDCNPFRLRSGAGPRCRHRGHSGETSQLGFPHTCRCTSAEPGPDASENVASDPLPQGRHRTFRSRSFALRHGSCLLPLKLPSILTRTTPFSVPPAARILSRLRGHRRPSGAFLSDHSIRDDSSLFHIPAATPERFDGSLFVPNRREWNHHTGSQ
jgi:hypothetical protein